MCLKPFVAFMSDIDVLFLCCGVLTERFMCPFFWQDLFWYGGSEGGLLTSSIPLKMQVAKKFRSKHSDATPH